jgi:hypothetical protein
MSESDSETAHGFDELVAALRERFGESCWMAVRFGDGFFYIFSGMVVRQDGWTNFAGNSESVAHEVARCLKSNKFNIRPETVDELEVIAITPHY